MLDRNGLVQMLNRAAKDYFKLSEFSDAIEKPCYVGLLKRLSPCDGCQVSFSHESAYERKSPVYPERLEQVVVYTKKDDAGNSEATIVRITDITQARIMERQLIQSEKLASLGLLISGIAHEINNPNSFISFNLPILRDYLNLLMPIIDDHFKERNDFEPFGMPYKEFREDLFKLLDNMEHGSSRINATVSGLKEFARKREKSGLQQVDLKLIVEKAATLCRSEVNKKVKTFNVNVPDSLPMIFSDPEALEQVVVNLLINASHAADKDDSWLKLEVLPREKLRQYWAIEISDNGCGMDEATKCKVFDPFFTTKATGKGTGLGLYVSQSLMDGIGGRIEVDSEPGHGSTFHVLLCGEDRPRDREVNSLAGFSKDAE